MTTKVRTIRPAKGDVAEIRIDRRRRRTWLVIYERETPLPIIQAVLSAKETRQLGLALASPKTKQILVEGAWLGRRPPSSTGTK